MNAWRCGIFVGCVLLAGCAAAPPATTETASAQLQRLLADSDEAMLRRNPIDALYRGDLRFAAQHGDYVSDAYIAAERDAASDALRRLATIDREALPSADRLAYDTFRWERETEQRSLAPRFVSFKFRLRPDQFNAWHLFFAELSSGSGAAPYRNAADYDDGLARIAGFIAWLDATRTRLREGAAEGIVHPRFVVERLVAQFDELIAQGVEGSTFYGPVRQWPDTLPAAERERLAAAYRATIADRLLPAFTRLRDFLRDEYLPRARVSVGLAQLPGGAAWYAQRIAEQTTTTMTAEQIHGLGRAEVQRIHAAMDAVRAEVGFSGTLAQFFVALRDDARFRPVSVQALLDGYRAIGRRVDAAMPRLFRHTPRTPLEMRETPAYQARTDAAARYQSGNEDGSRPGVFYVNTFDLPTRSTWRMETLYLHEALPGHHFQISLAQEQTALPKLLRFGGNAAYAEGWALYAESLGPELGMFADPYQRFGRLDDENLRAMRLVVDTGLHALGWTREQAIEFMLANSAMSRTDASAEVERYIANPAQALAYKIGELTIRRLRERGQAALGAAFDVRDFHDQVLMSGALPLAVLESKIDAWIAQRRAGGAPAN